MLEKVICSYESLFTVVANDVVARFQRRDNYIVIGNPEETSV